ncbi:hypothetical protein HYS92_02775 [Candidatus Daviesbacteria bacterium]|nr:hypothetical protein [Candidatus Daviesbacteria bacterium]
MSKKTIILILFLGILILVIVLVLINRGGPVDSPRPVPYFSPSPSATPITLPSEEKLSIVNINPPENLSFKKLPIVQIEITFNEPVAAQDFSYTVSPHAESYVKLRIGTNTLVLTPKTNWQPGITTITILNGTKSQNGKLLEKPFSYELDTEFPPGL